MTSSSPTSARLVVVSNRGPVAHAFTDGGAITTTKTGGGLASGVRPVLREVNGLWLCAPVNEADDHIAALGDDLVVDGVRSRFAPIAASTRHAAIDIVANQVLWFTHHGLSPVASTASDLDWRSFDDFNAAMASEVVNTAPANAPVLVQDYHLPSVAAHARRQRSDLRFVHFSHTPFADPASWRALPTRHRSRLLAAMAAHHACGFHSQRWADRFSACCELDGIDPPRTFVVPLAPDVSAMRAAASTPGALAEVRRLGKLRSNQQLIVRVDRLEPTKNLVAGFHAFDQMLQRRPSLIGKVTMCAYAYPSRSELDAYRRLRSDVIDTVTAVNARHGRADWLPIHLNLDDDLEAAAAALTASDVLLVNPIEDGLNLVVFEGAALNEVDGTAVLSTTCGAHDQLGDLVTPIDPLDVAQTSRALERALQLRPNDRRAMARAARAVVENHRPDEWLRRQIEAAHQS